MRSKHDKLRGAKPVNRWFNVFTRLCVEPVVRRVFKLTAVNPEIIPQNGPAIIVANHVNLLDPPWIYSVLSRPVHFVATEELFRKTILSAAIRSVGVFPIRKAARDFQSVKNIITLLREGVLIGIYPEGSRSWDGTNSPVIPTIARLIRRMKVPVYSCRVDGGYLHFPRWAAKMRPVPIRLVFNKLYDGDSLPDSDEEIIADIAAAIRIQDYELKLPAAKRRVSGLALGVNRLLYRCPHCQSLESLRTMKPKSTNRVECRSCYSTWEVDLGSRLTPVDDHGTAAGESRTVAQLYQQIKAMPLNTIHSSLIQLENGEQLYLASRPHFLYREKSYPELRIFGFGRAFLTDRRFVFQGRLKRRGNVRVSAPLEEIESLSIEPGDKLHFIYRGVLYRIPFHRESAAKWYDFLDQLAERRKATISATPSVKRNQTSRPGRPAESK
jgi:1-acyl-sn-glycerol-3-phosphate acyltransferase